MPVRTVSRLATESLTIWTRADRVGDLLSVTLTLDLPAGVVIEPDAAADGFFTPTVVTVEGLADATVAYPLPVTVALPYTDLPVPVFGGPTDITIVGRVPESSDDVGGTITFQPTVRGDALSVRTVRWVAPTHGTAAYTVPGALSP